MSWDPWHYEKISRQEGKTCIAGVDEAGRGPLAGPVVAAAVVLPDDFSPSGTNDSKKLNEKKRRLLYTHIYSRALTIGIGIVDAYEIDRINIHRASLLAMSLAVKNLFPYPDFLLIDGKFIISKDLPQKAIPKGDSLSISIGAASIIAKVTRDSLMARYHEEFPFYGFDKHKGYPTKYHLQAIRTHGCSRIHRKSFKGVRETVNPLFDFMCR
jgi:ribonuclease HII